MSGNIQKFLIILLLQHTIQGEHPNSLRLVDWCAPHVICFSLDPSRYVQCYIVSKNLQQGCLGQKFIHHKTSSYFSSNRTLFLNFPCILVITLAICCSPSSRLNFELALKYLDFVLLIANPVKYSHLELNRKMQPAWKVWLSHFSLTEVASRGKHCNLPKNRFFLYFLKNLIVSKFNLLMLAGYYSDYSLMSPYQTFCFPCVIFRRHKTFSLVAPIYSTFVGDVWYSILFRKYNLS